MALILLAQPYGSRRLNVVITKMSSDIKAINKFAMILLAFLLEHCVRVSEARHLLPTANLTLIAKISWLPVSNLS